MYKHVLIYGYGGSGKSVERALQCMGIKYSVYVDKVDKDISYVDNSVFVSKLNKKILQGYDLVVVSPGVSMFAKNIRMMKDMGIEVIGEIEFAYRYIDTPIIAVTGTNGKTTTVSMLSEVLGSKYRVKAMGNIGVPMSECILEDGTLDYIVAEVSSFQLESIDTFSPSISVILNIAPDHIDRHGSMDNYIQAKLNMCKNNTGSSIVVLNADDENILKNVSNVKGKIYYISKYDKSANVYMDAEYIYYRIGRSRGKVALSEIYMYTNPYNIMAVMCVCILLKMDIDDIVHKLKSYKVYAHRLEYVGRKDGVTYIDDSKSTNVHSTLNALECMSGKDNILILGGFDKKLYFDDIFSIYSDKIKYIVAYGKCRKRIYTTAKKYKYKKIISIKNFDEAVLTAVSLAKDNDVVLLSPACSSFDEFSSYKERGDRFVKIIREVAGAKM